MKENGKLPILLFLWSMIALHGCTSDDQSKNVQFDDQTDQWVVEHPETGRLWLRCDIGQRWDKRIRTCIGERSEMYYSEAMTSCPDGFSLPSNEDMATVLCNYVDNSASEGGHRKYDPCRECSNCREMFPEEKGLYFSSTTFLAEGDTDKSSYEFDFQLGYVWLLHVSDTELSNVTCIRDE